MRQYPQWRRPPNLPGLLPPRFAYIEVEPNISRWVPSLPSEPHLFQVAVYFRFQLGHAARYLRQRGFVAFGEFLHTLSKLLAHAVHFAVDGGVEGGEPFVVDDK